MRFPKTIVLAAAALFLPCEGAAADSCAETAKTQLDLNLCADETFKKADRELNELYKKILTEYADDPKFIEKLKMAQRAWLKFRDAEMDALFPHQDEDRYYGSVYPMCSASWLTTLTQERIAQLRKWSDKVQQGDICSGSIKVKE
ncbi:lysozyme inhibitor LprI family protein [Desulfobulbus propionicus]